MRNLVGEQLGPYQLVEWVGSGTLGRVFRGVCAQDGRSAAVKVFFPEVAAQRSFRMRLFEGAQTLSTLRHPALVPLFGAGEQDRFLFVDSEWVHGPEQRPLTLRQRVVQAGGRLPAAKVAEILESVCSAAAAAHAKGILHRAMTPGNVLLVGAREQARVTDTGLVELAGAMVLRKRVVRGMSGTLERDETENTEDFTNQQVALQAAFDFMPPEAWSRESAWSVQGDVYALGVLTYWMLTGQLPGDPSRMPGECGVDVPETWDRAIRRALSPRPEARWASPLDFYAALSSATPARTAAGAPERPRAVGPRRAGDEMVLAIPGSAESIVLCWCPPGSFEMGAPDSDERAAFDERPAHRRDFPCGFWIGKYPITQSQWMAVKGDNPSCFSGPDHPVEQVSWEQARDFLLLLSELTGRVFRLPTEAEWEYACRAGSTTRYFHGQDDERLIDYVWGGPNAEESTQPVGTKPPNAWGIHDLLGNVWEWCEDWYDSRAYALFVADGIATPAQGQFRVVRGAAWDDFDADSFRCACRRYSNPLARSNTLGFRCILEP